MNMLPDHACDGHRSHETHDHDALAFHDLPLKSAEDAEGYTQRIHLCELSELCG